MNEKLQAFKNSTCFPWELICRLSKLDFSANEIMVILLCLTELDNADCLRLEIEEVADRLNLCTRTVYYALNKLKGFGVTRDFKRYFFGDFLVKQGEYK